MYITKSLTQLAPLAVTTALLLSFKPAIAADETVNIRISTGNSWQARNDVQIPNTDLGTRFSLYNTVGAGPVTAGRFELNWSINQRHGIRIMLAPLAYTETTTFSQPVSFNGETFSADVATEASYRFNSWRVGYHYTLAHNDKSSMRVGATLKVRDAEIRLEQGGTVSANDNVGLVPLLYLAGAYHLSDHLTVKADLDGLAGGPGRAIDVGLAVDFALNKKWNIGAEVRVLDGGADTDEVYNFAQFNSVAIAVSTGF